jgi:hypothetical protein
MLSPRFFAAKVTVTLAAESIGFGIKKGLSGMRGPLGGAYLLMKKPLPKEEALYARLPTSSPRRTTSAGIGTEHRLDINGRDNQVAGVS